MPTCGQVAFDRRRSLRDFIAWAAIVNPRPPAAWSTAKSPTTQGWLSSASGALTSRRVTQSLITDSGESVGLVNSRSIGELTPGEIGFAVFPAMLNERARSSSRAPPPRGRGGLGWPGPRLL